jgi:solute carrier family 50 protein (sugar transporter)
MLYELAFLTAPVNDLRRSLQEGSLGSLNPFPWTLMTGNCLGWVVYGYYTRDPFIVASNLPGLILSIWLNLGAAKLQYLELMQDEKNNHRDIEPRRTTLDADSAEDPEDLVLQATQNPGPAEQAVMVPQERALLRMLVFWALVLIYAGWIDPSHHQAQIIGVVVNVNLVFFYGAPLQTMRTVIVQKSSESIHAPTMVMNWFNTSFWLAYGIARKDLIIVLPNAIGLFLGVSQGFLCLLYPRSKRPEEAQLLNDGQEATSPSATTSEFI